MFKADCFETEAYAGDPIGEVLQRTLDKATFAVLVLTGEDIMADGRLRARQNVVHEIGLFQGALRGRTVMLRQEGVEGFANVAGVLQLHFKGKNIKTTFEKLRRALIQHYPEYVRQSMAKHSAA